MNHHSELRTTCEECERDLTPFEREDSYQLTYNDGEGRVLCGKHLDAELRQRRQR